MKAMRFHRHGGPEVLQLDEVPRPEPAAHELLVRIEAAGVNYADTVRRWGDHYPIPTPLPAIAGAEVVGTVVAVGAGADPGWVGQRVLGAPPLGGYAEYVCVPQGHAFRLPAGLHPHQGLALFVQGLTAALILKRAGRPAPGEAVFVEGASGGVGSLGVQLARRYGARTVIGAASSPEKRARVLSLGADAAIDYGAAGWSSEVLRLTGNRGVDVVMEMTGGEVFREAMQCLAPGGRVVVYGIASRKPFQVPTEKLIARGQVVAGFYLGQYLHERALIEQTLEEFAGFVAAGQLTVEVGAALPLAEAAEAHRRLESRQSSAKIVLVPAP
jgi:NADPH2:quinone reductase